MALAAPPCRDNSVHALSIDFGSGNLQQRQPGTLDLQSTVQLFAEHGMQLLPGRRVERYESDRNT